MVEIIIPPLNEEEICYCICHGLIAHDYGLDHKCCDTCPSCGEKIKVNLYNVHIENCK